MACSSQSLELKGCHTFAGAPKGRTCTWKRTSSGGLARATFNSPLLYCQIAARPRCHPRSPVQRHETNSDHAGRLLYQAETVASCIVMFSFSFLVLLLQIAVLSSSTNAAWEPKQREVGQPNNLFFTDEVLEFGINVTIAGTSLTLVVDTGSTDIFLLTLEPTHQFGTRMVQARMVPLDWPRLKSPASEFLLKGNATAYSGLVGFGFDDPTDPIPVGLTAMGVNGSVVGKSVLSNIFDQYPDKSRFFAVSLSRPGEDGTADGLLTIGEYDDRYSEVQHAPLLPQFPQSSRAWSFLMDGIFVAWPFDPNVTVPDGQAVGLLDTGTYSLVVPPDIRDFIYRVVPGAVQTGKNSSLSPDDWIIPCATAVDVHLVFGGQNFTMHPLDLTDIYNYVGPDGQNYTVCTGTIESGDEIGWDRGAIFGQAFLRNVYTVYGFYSPVNLSLKNFLFRFGFGNDTIGPYAQLLSQTDRTEAGAEFSAVRSQLLSAGAPELSPSDIVQLFDGPSSLGSGGSSNSAALDAAAATTPGSSTDTSSLGKYGPAGISHFCYCFWASQFQTS
ncbi:aspartic peptidase domain-containing protein [Mycena filopes]|nr:aspartic peptidase domain-containing protein [Mycena filopes]